MKRRDFSIAAVAALASVQLGGLRSAAAQQISNIKMMIPANPGGGWDQTGRALATAMQSAKTVGSKTRAAQPARSGWRSSSMRRKVTPTR